MTIKSARMLYPCYRFIIRDPAADRLWPAMAAFIDIFDPEGDTLWIGKAVSADGAEDLFNLPDRIEIWGLPFSRAQGICFKATIAIDPNMGWSWSPVNFDSNVDGVALEWAKGRIELLDVQRVHVTDAPPSVQSRIA